MNTNRIFLTIACLLVMLSGNVLCLQAQEEDLTSDAKGFTLPYPRILDGYDGGMNQFLKDNIALPEDKDELLRVLGKDLQLEFDITKDGQLVDPVVTKGISPFIDEQLIALCNKMKVWKPAKHDGEICDFHFRLPIYISSRKNISLTYDTYPRFGDGAADLQAYLIEHLIKPLEADLGKMNGRMRLKFRVLKDGSIGDKFTIKHSFGDSLADSTIISVIKDMPKWQPALYNGKALARVKYVDLTIRHKDELEVSLAAKPFFIGGRKELNAYIWDKFDPKLKSLTPKKKTVVAKFGVDEEGNLNNIRISESIDPRIDAEFVRILENMPRWIPARNDDQPISSTYTIPLSFGATTRGKIVIEKPAKYVGGYWAMKKFFEQNMILPPSVRNGEAAGYVCVDTRISPEGKVKAIGVARGINPEVDAEAMRLVGLMDDWTPGSTNGELCPMVTTINVYFCKSIVHAY